MSALIPKVLMCPPEFFGVEYVINPWMEGNIGGASLAAAKEQWQALQQQISKLTDVETITPGEHLPDMCFAANGGLILGDTFVAPNFRVDPRKPEENLFSEWAKANNLKVVSLPDDESFEGEGDALFHPGQRLLWAGYGVRSSLEAHRTLTDLLNVEVASLRLVDQRFYHLDTCFYPLPDNRVVYYPEAFDELSLQEIRRRVPAENRIEVCEADALRFTCNAVRLGKTILTNHAGEELQGQLKDWGYDVICVPVEEFLLAGGAAKCLTLLLEQDCGGEEPEGRIESPIRTTHLTVEGHLLDAGILNRVIDTAANLGGSIKVEEFRVGGRKDQPSQATVRVTAPSAQRLDSMIGDLMPMGAVPSAPPADINLEAAPADGVAPDSFYATTIYPTDVRINGEWVRVDSQRMDGVMVVDTQKPSARCCLIRDVKKGEDVVCGYQGIRVTTPQPQESDGEDFSFMSSSVSTERRVELVVESLAWEIRRIRARGGRVVVVAGPVVIHTGGGRHLSRLIQNGFIQGLLTGNALPVHDMELNMFGTSLGVDLSRGIGIRGGHTHHLRAINRVRAAGSIAAAVEQGVVTDGVMYSCVKHGVDYVLAGSIRDDGPLPDTLMDLEEAQAAYAETIKDTEMILMLSSMLHSIGTGNMTRSGIRLVCVDINPSVATKLADRGSLESTAIVTDVGLFLNLLAAKLCD